MAVKKKFKVSPKVVAKAKEVLEFARQRADTATDWLELSNALYSVGGKATTLFPTETERTAFFQTEEYKQILALMDSLPQPKLKGFVKMVETANGAISVRLPRSVHAALLVEAEAEGVSLNQLCTAKLIAQLRAVL